MLDYILKSGACLAIFLLFYKLLLEKESVHVFKRFYLLGALAASFLIPSIIFTEYVEFIQADISTQIPTTDLPTKADITQTTETGLKISWEFALWSLYGLGVIGFGFRFLKHLIQIWSRIKSNPTLKNNFIIKVLLQEQLPPHTFFSYIFLNKHKFETNRIPEAVLLHEETHAKQKHSLDVLIIEFIQVILWFNPLIYLFKKNIKLNHEFLADSAVLSNHKDPITYQNTLLAYLSNDSFEKYQSTGIANAINYSSIKKRFIIMKTKTSKKAILFRSVLILPILATLLFGFSETRLVQKETSASQTIQLEFLRSGIILLEDEPVLINELSENINRIFLNKFTSKETKVRIKSEVTIYMDFINKVSEEIKKTGINDIEIFVDEVIMAKKEYQAQIDVTPETVTLKTNKMTFVGDYYQESSNQESITKYNTLAKKYNAIPIEKRVIPLSDLNILETTYKSMSPSDRKEAQPFPECLPKNKQDGASRQQIKEYNTLAKKYNEMDSYRMRISKSDVERLEFIYGLMSDKQKADAEPFPDFPEPPAPKAPKAPNTPDYADNVIEDTIENQEINAVENVMVYSHNVGVKSAKSSSLMDNLQSLAIRDAQFYFDGKEISTEEGLQIVKDKKNIFVETMPYTNKKPEVKIYTNQKDVSTPTPPAPPIPQSPIDHVIDMAKKGAKFMYEDKEISSDKAIELLKKNTELHIESRTKKGNTIVRITKDPVTRE